MKSDRSVLARAGIHPALLCLAGAFVVLWIGLAVDPVDRQDWLLENLLVFASVAGLALSYRRFPLTHTSYALIIVFLGLHSVGAHYTYAEVPFGHWLASTLDLDRNPFDRLLHFGFGLLITWPIREVLVRIHGYRGAWSSVLPVLIVLAAGGAFEIVESWVARIVSPELGQLYLGTQGDVWDAQKDMTQSVVGAAVAMAVAAVLRAEPVVERGAPRIRLRRR